MACIIIITTYPGDSIDCQLELSLQYLYTCLPVKTKKQVHTFSRETLVEIFCKTKIWLISLLEADFNDEKQISSNQTLIFGLVEPTLKWISSRSLESDVSSFLVYCDWWPQVSKAIKRMMCELTPLQERDRRGCSWRDKQIIAHIEWLPTWMLYNIKLYFVNMYMCIYL